MITEIHVLHICLGNSDDQFLSVLDRRKGKIMNGMVQSAFVDDFFPTTVEGVQCTRTVRASKCEMVVSDEKCTACKEYWATLQSLSSRQKQQASTSTRRTDALSHVNFRYLSTPEKPQLESETSRNSFVCLVFDEVKIKEDLIMTNILTSCSHSWPHTCLCSWSMAFFLLWNIHMFMHLCYCRPAYLWFGVVWGDYKGQVLKF